MPAAAEHAHLLRPCSSAARECKATLKVMQQARNSWLHRHGCVVAAPPLTPTQRAEIEDVFRLLDGDGSGAIDVQELLGAFGTLGIGIDRDDILALLREVNPHHAEDGHIDFEAFCSLMGHALKLDKQHGKLYSRQAAGPKRMGQVGFTDAVRAYRRKRFIMAVEAGGAERQQLMVQHQRTEAVLTAELARLRARVQAAELMHKQQTQRALLTRTSSVFRRSGSSLSRSTSFRREKLRDRLRAIVSATSDDHEEDAASPGGGSFAAAVQLGQVALGGDGADAAGLGSRPSPFSHAAVLQATRTFAPPAADASSVGEDSRRPPERLDSLGSSSDEGGPPAARSRRSVSFRVGSDGLLRVVSEDGDDDSSDAGVEVVRPPDPDWQAAAAAAAGAADHTTVELSAERRHRQPRSRDRSPPKRTKSVERLGAAGVPTALNRVGQVEVQWQSLSPLQAHQNGLVASDLLAQVHEASEQAKLARSASPPSPVVAPSPTSPAPPSRPTLLSPTAPGTGSMRARQGHDAPPCAPRGPPGSTVGSAGGTSMRQRTPAAPPAAAGRPGSPAGRQQHGAGVGGPAAHAGPHGQAPTIMSMAEKVLLGVTQHLERMQAHLDDEVAKQQQLQRRALVACAPARATSSDPFLSIVAGPPGSRVHSRPPSRAVAGGGSGRGSRPTSPDKGACGACAPTEAQRPATCPPGPRPGLAARSSAPPSTASHTTPAPPAPAKAAPQPSCAPQPSRPATCPPVAARPMSYVERGGLDVAVRRAVRQAVDRKASGQQEAASQGRTACSPSASAPASAVSGVQQLEGAAAALWWPAPPHGVAAQDPPTCAAAPGSEPVASGSNRPISPARSSGRRQADPRQHQQQATVSGWASSLRAAGPGPAPRAQGGAAPDASATGGTLVWEGYTLRSALSTPTAAAAPPTSAVPASHFVTGVVAKPHVSGGRGPAMLGAATGKLGKGAAGRCSLSPDLKVALAHLQQHPSAAALRPATSPVAPAPAPWPRGHQHAASVLEARLTRLLNAGALSSSL